MLSLIYVSTASAPMTQGELDNLIEQSAANNRAAGVTGLLAYNSQNFMQLLEDEGDAVLSIMRKIEQDKRHSNIVYLRQDTRGERECPDWAMHPLLTPLSGLGSANVFTGSLPKSMELDTKILFTSFASSLKADAAMRIAEDEAKFQAEDRARHND